MPIKEIMALSAALMASIMVTHPTRPLEAVREVELRIDCTRSAERTTGMTVVKLCLGDVAFIIQVGRILLVNFFLEG